VRGQREDYDHWAQRGNPGWSWAEVGPVFESLETFQRGKSEGRGQAGPLQVSDPRLTREICELWLKAAVAAGFPANSDYNSATQEGVGHFQLTADRGFRCLPMRRGFLYLVAIMDWLTRKVLAWRISNTLEADFCVEALNEAIHKFGPPEIMNTDQGSQFTSFAWTDRLKQAGTRISMDGDLPPGSSLAVM